MDLLGKRRIKQLEESLAEKERMLNIQQIGWKESENKITYLLQTIRDMDEQIYKMSQYTSWEQMRPHFINLQEGMTVRKRIESDRIGSLVRQELQASYDPKLIESRRKGNG